MEPREYLNILHVAERLKDIPRHCTTSKRRVESVAEHSWRVSLMALLLKNEFPDVDVDKVVSMCLIHDLGECFTGDIPTFQKMDSDRVAEDTLYILHPNNVGRCGHICNASYAVSSKCRGLHIGEKLVIDCLSKGKELGFRVLQFNALVESNVHARHLYERLGFVQLGTIPGGFGMKDGHYENICPYYHTLYL